MADSDEGSKSVFSDANHQSSDSQSDAELLADAVALTKMNEMLMAVEQQYDSGRMRAFGEHNDRVLREFEEVRRDQESLFRKHMDLEMNFLSSVDGEKGSKHYDPPPHSFEDDNSKFFCQQLPAMFKAREASVHRITSDIHSLGKKLSSISQMVPSPPPSAPPMARARSSTSSVTTTSVPVTGAGSGVGAGSRS